MPKLMPELMPEPCPAKFNQDSSRERIPILDISDAQPQSRAEHKPLLQGVGDLLQANRRGIQVVQWLVVIFYVALLIWPALLPLPKDYVHFYENLVLLAQFVFWGLWWPFVILSMMLLGRVWCGVFCPEGSLSEWSSRRGLGLTIPRWLRWGGWPFVAFVSTTVYGQLISVYEYPKAALLILGGSTIIAMLVGFLYGRGKRVWCRYLCPVSGVFSLLARLAPIHFSVDRQRWQQPVAQYQAAPDCAPMISIRTMTGNKDCHMCGRCSGYRDAVSLKTRSPNQEIMAISSRDVNPWDVCLLVFGMLGIATGAFQWSASPWFVQLKQHLADWVLNQDLLWLFNDHVPWWLLTHYPESNDLFSWLDGLCILLYIGATAVIISAGILISLSMTGRLLLHNNTMRWRLGYALTPLAGANVFIGLSSLTVSMLAAEHIDLAGMAELRVALLLLAYSWSGYLLGRMLRQNKSQPWRKLWAWLLIMSSSSTVGLSWVFMFYLW